MARCSRLSGRVRSLREKSAEELGAMFGSSVQLPEDFGSPRRRRLFFPLAGVLALPGAGILRRPRLPGNRAQVPGAAGLGGQSPPRSRTAGYCRARRRLRQQDLDATHERLVRKVRAAHLPRGLWFGRPVKVVDGSGLSMPDTAANQRAYPQPKGAKPGCSFPVMRVVAVFCLGTGVLISLAKGSLHVGERALFRSLWDLLDPGDVVLADRGFCGYAEFYFLLRRGVDCVMRNHQRRTVGRTVLKRLAPGRLPDPLAQVQAPVRSGRTRPPGRLCHKPSRCAKSSFRSP